MRFRVVMKTPDALETALREELNCWELSNDKFEDKVAVVLEECEKWFRNGEYLTVEIDTNAETCKVVEDK